jgi:cysteine desulfurase/selenocysteine lyase
MSFAVAPKRDGSVVSVPPPPLDIKRIRADFSILRERVHGHRLVYLDNASTTQKPDAVIDALVHYYRHDNAMIHRGVHRLAERATQAYEAARETVRAFLNAENAREIVFLRGATEAINLVAQTYGRRNVACGDEVLITAMEHHSNIVPWQMLCEEKGAHLRVAPINQAGELDLDEFQRLLGSRTRIVSVAHVSNALGVVNPIKEIVRIAHAARIPVLVDGAQTVPHLPVDVCDLDCDFYTFSGHKIYGPTGIGALYGKAALLEEMPPWQGGSDMIGSVTFEQTLYNRIPCKFEAGSPNIEGAIGLAAALDYIRSLGMESVAAYEHDLLAYAVAKVGSIPSVSLIGAARDMAPVLSFVMQGVHPHDIGAFLDREGIAVRTGHHSAQPLMEFFAVPATVRASFAIYNTKEEIDVLAASLHKAKSILG